MTIDETTTAAYVLPVWQKERIKQLAKDEDRSESAVMRRILTEYFEREAATPAKAPNGKTARPTAA